MKQLILLTAIILSTQLIQAQSYVKYTYDDAGNRKERRTVIIPSFEDKDKNENKVTEVSDIFGKGNITIYPNPTDELLTIQFTGIEIKEEIILQLYDIKGKLIKEKKTKNYKTILSLNNNTSGVYILKIFSEKNRAEFTVVKE